MNNRSVRWRLHASRKDELVAKAPWVLATLFIFAVGYWSHVSRYLNLSSDEIYFYYSSHYPSIAEGGYHQEMVDRLIDEAPAIDAGLRASGNSTGELGDAVRYLPKQLDSFGDYPISHIFWGLFSDLPTSADQLPITMSRSVVRFLIASGAFTFLVTGLILLLGCSVRYVRVACIAVFALFLIQDVAFNRQFFLLGNTSTEGLVGHFLWTLDSHQKDLLFWSFSPRSNFLVMLIAFFGLRWSGSWLGSYAFLAFTAAWHSSHGILLLAFAVAVDAAFRFSRILKLEVAICALLAMWFALLGNMVPGSVRPLLLSIVGVVLLALAGLRISMRWRPAPFLSRFVANRSDWNYAAKPANDIAVFTVGCMALYALLPTAQAYMNDQNSWTIATIVLRLGCISAVLIPLFMVSAVCGVESGNTTAVETRDSSTGWSTGSVIAAMIALTAFVCTDLRQLRSQQELEERLLAQAEGIAARRTQPATFVNTTEMERLWYSILLSEIDRSDQLLPLSGENRRAPAPPSGGPSPYPGAEKVDAAVDSIADLSNCAGAIQAYLGFNPLTDKNRDAPDWLPTFFSIMRALESGGVEYRQRVDGISAAAAVWSDRPRVEQEQQSMACLERYPS